MKSIQASPFSAVYGPVKSWRFGRSLGIDPIGPISTCSFNCVYCQLGEIEQLSMDRRVFIPTVQILHDLQACAPWDVDVITLSGSGEPTLALNLAEILIMVRAHTDRPIVVLTNGTLLKDSAVRSALALADQVVVKIDSVFPEQLKCINRPIEGINNLPEIFAGLQQFRQEYQNQFLAIQTMLLSPWDETAQTNYIRWMQALSPDEIQLNTPTRPKPLKHHLEGRGNHPFGSQQHPSVYPAQKLKCLRSSTLQEFAAKIQQSIDIPVRWNPKGDNDA
jgi:wyosine [tRNA(Phe)-imidazoG37] synthetase (radical SAM superfamily)